MEPEILQDTFLIRLLGSTGSLNGFSSREPVERFQDSFSFVRMNKEVCDGERVGAVPVCATAPSPRSSLVSGTHGAAFWPGQGSPQAGPRRAQSSGR